MGLKWFHIFKSREDEFNVEHAWARGSNLSKFRVQTSANIFLHGAICKVYGNICYNVSIDIKF